LDNLLSVSEARQHLLKAFSPVQPESIPLIDSHGRVLAEQVTSPIDLPIFDNSSMDGFAVRAEDIAQANAGKPVVLRVVVDIPAGTLAAHSIESGEAGRIMTGAPLPSGADAIVPVENTDHYRPGEKTGTNVPETVQIFSPVNAGAFVRSKGQDVRAGQVVLHSGARLRPQDLGLLAMLGCAEVSAFRRPRVAMFSTGDELLPVHMALEPGMIHDSNAYTLSSQVLRDGGQPVYLGIAPDREEEVEALLERAVAEQADLIVSSAGVSVGAFDFVRSVVERHGHLTFWRVNMRPGKPIAFGSYRGTPFIGLPGNPVSAFVGYEVFVSFALNRLAGLPDKPRPVLSTRLLEPVESDGRESYLRAIAYIDNGSWFARLTGHQGSGNLLSLVQANALLIIPSGVKSLPIGAEVQAWLLE
jgi:molybdopterin molybdotransferase